MKSNAIAVIAEITDLHGSIHVEGTKIVYRTPKGTMTEPLKQQLRDAKPVIMWLLQLPKDDGN